jgi:hypothetical protein
MMCIHMAMAVEMRIAFNIVLCFYRTSTYPVKPHSEKTTTSALSSGLQFSGKLPIVQPGGFAMKICWILALFCCSTPLFGLSGGMEKATVHAMRKVPCMVTRFL